MPTSRKFLFITSTVLAQENLSVFVTRLLQEGHQVAVTGPVDLQLPEEVIRIRNGTEGIDWNPNVVIPMDERAAEVLAHSGAFKGSKARQFCKEPLAFQMSCCRSFGLSLVAKTGMPTIPYHVLANEGDMLRLQAKMAETPEQAWTRCPDHPAMMYPDANGALAVPAQEGEIVRVAYLISGRNLVTPAFVHYPLIGLLARGGVPDWRGCVVIPTWNDKIAFIGGKVQLACSSIGASGFVFVDLLFPPGKRGKASVLNITLTPPRGFLAAVFLSGMTGFGVGEALNQVAANKEFYLRTELLQPAFAFLVTDQAGGEGFPVGESWLEFPSPGYERGWHISTNAEVSEELWDIRPTGEIKLDGQRTLDYALSRMEYFRLLPKEGSTPLEARLEEDELEPEEQEQVILQDALVGEVPDDEPLTEMELALLATCNGGEE